MIENEKTLKSDIDSKCPSLETVSAYFDGELDAESPDARHIKKCPECAEHLKYFAKLAVDLKKEMSFFTPGGYGEGLQAILKKRVKREGSEEALQFPFILKVAAMFAGAALIILTLLTDECESPKTQSSLPSADPIVFLGDEKSFGARDMTSLPVPASDSNALVDSTINMSDLTPVGTGATGYRPRLKLKASPAVDKAGIITKNVRQTWSVPNIQKAEKFFIESTPSKARATATENSDGNLTLKVALTKKELAELVRGCSAAGFKLLSPAQPQPEQQIFAGDAETKVSYTAVLVQE
ncbi:MAG: zf-HC2 domain-containing protein [Victivallales bacterium]|nr:zf-HC2 domain-containing protein [Victivallales bacterium]